MSREPVATETDIEFEFTLTEISHSCGVGVEQITVLVGEGVLSPRGASRADWRFAGSDLARALRAVRLERDLGVNPAGAALAIELMEEMQRLRQRLERLEALLSGN
jgi:chaperone modulatory protein CbpM